MRLRHERCTAVLFDFDGTYADTAPDMVGALNRLLLADGRPTVDYETARPYVSHGSKALVRLGFGDLAAAEQSRLIERFLTTYEADIAAHTKAFDGIDDWIAALEKRQIRWGIVTNKPEHLTLKVLDLMDLPYAPHCMVAGDSLIKRKPHPMPALHAAALLETPAHECIFVGDSLSDITAGSTAGMFTIATAYGYIVPGDSAYAWNADVVVESVEDLRQQAEARLVAPA